MTFSCVQQYSVLCISQILLYMNLWNFVINFLWISEILFQNFQKISSTFYYIHVLYLIYYVCTLSFTTQFFVFVHSSRQARVPSRVRTVSGGAGASERSVRHRIPRPIRVSSSAHPTQDPAGSSLLCSPAGGGAADPARLRLDARGLRTWLYPAGEKQWLLMILQKYLKLKIVFHFPIFFLKKKKPLM